MDDARVVAPVTDSAEDLYKRAIDSAPKGGRSGGLVTKGSDRISPELLVACRALSPPLASATFDPECMRALSDAVALADYGKFLARIREVGVSGFDVACRGWVDTNDAGEMTGGQSRP